jgi:hypothetical protein
MTATKRHYNPHRIRRAVRLLNPELMARTGQASFVSKSMTRPQHEDCYHPTVDIESGACRCDCAHFEFRLARHNPTVWSPREHLCKHLLKALLNLKRRGLLPQQQGRFSPACVKCGVLEADNYFEVGDERGEIIPGQFICGSCIEAQIDDLSDVPQEIEPEEYSGYEEWLDELPEEAPEPPSWELRGMMGQPCEVLP